MPSDSYLTCEGARIAYQYNGSGAPIGYAHGVPLSRKAVRGLDLFDFDALAAGRHLLTYDQRGHGRSTGRPVAEDYHFDTFARDLLALMDALEISQPMDFAGSSLGCDTALRAAIAAPDRFRRLVLMIPPIAWDGAEHAKQWYFDSADSIEELGAKQWRAQWALSEPPPIFADYPRYRFDPDVADDLLPAILRGVGASDLPAPAAIATLRHPALILTWDTDPLHPVSTAERLRDLLPHSELHVATSVADIKAWTERITDFVNN